MVAENDKLSYPRIPESNWWILRDQFIKTLPKEVTFSYLKSLLGLTSEQAARNLLYPLRRIGLIDDEGKPTDRANQWRSDKSYPQVCASIIDEVYPQELRDLHSGQEIDRAAVEEWFRDTAAQGKATAGQSAAFYILLNQASPKSSADYGKSGAARQTKLQSKKNEKKQTSKISTADTDVVPTNISTQIPASTLDDWFSLHIDLQIHISPDASAQQIDHIFASMAKHIMTMKRTPSNND